MTAAALTPQGWDTARELATRALADGLEAAAESMGMTAVQARVLLAVYALSLEAQP